MARVAVTGGVACGKSVVGARLASAHGMRVLDTDDLAHELMEPGQPAYGDVVREFGAAILEQGGRVDRRLLGQQVFADPVRLAALNRIVHPRVLEGMGAWLEGQPADAVAVAIVPLLYEIGAGAGWDAVICVAASQATQMARLRERGLSGEEAGRRIAAQMPVAAKMECADYVVYNEGTVELLEQQVDRIVQHIVENGQWKIRTDRGTGECRWTGDEEAGSTTASRRGRG